MLEGYVFWLLMFIEAILGIGIGIIFGFIIAKGHYAKDKEVKT